jgi:hypothetical protein
LHKCHNSQAYPGFAKVDFDQVDFEVDSEVDFEQATMMWQAKFIL